MTWVLAIVAVTVLAVAGVSRRLSGTPVTPAMVFVAIVVLVGPLFLDDVTASPRSSLVRTLAEATLALVLFCDASRIDARTLRRESAIPVRLLGIGLPLTVVLGSVLAGVLFAHLSVSEAIIIGVILAPTDAGLGQAVVTDRRTPQRIRQSLNVESGLNDGVCVPLLLIVPATASSAHHTSHVVLEESGLQEEAGALLDGVTFLFFGAVLLGPTLEHLSRQMVLNVGPERHGRLDPGGGARAVGHEGADADGAADRVARPPRARLDRVCRDRRGRAARAHRDDHRDHLPHDRTLGAPARAHCRPARQALRSPV